MEPIKDFSLEGLTARIAESSKTISDCINQHGIPKLSLDADAPAEFPVPPTFPAVHTARLALLEATSLLHRLVTGPSDHAMFTAASHHDTSTLRTLYRFKAFEAVPLDREIAYADVAKKIGLDEDRTTRVMQHAMTTGFFLETKPGYVVHSASSAAVARDERLRAMIGHFCEESYSAAEKYPEWLQTHPVDGQEPWEQGLTLAFRMKQSCFEFYDSEPEIGHRFGLAMSCLSRPGGPMDAEFVVRAFDWSSIGDATVVDVGGGRGHVSRGIATRFPNLDFIVQDYAKTLKPGEEALPLDLKTRFEFMPHDFFEPQPSNLSSRGNLVFYHRMILHDWSDKYCIKILQNLVTALKDGSIVLINESVMPPMGTVNKFVDRLGRLSDSQVMTCCNARERTAAEFERLFKAADPRFHLIKIHSTPGSSLSILEVRFNIE